MPDHSPKPSFSSGRRWLMWFNTLLGIAALVALVLMANYLASGYFKRFQWTPSHLDFSPQTTALLQRLTNQVEVTIFFNQRGEEEIYSLASSLLKQYNYANPKISVQSLDYTRAPAKATSLISKYKLTSLKDNNFIVFECNGRSKVVFGSELYDYDINAVLSDGGRTFRRETFKGELLFSSAIFSVTYPRQTKAYFVYGHGEHQPENANHDLGYARFASILKDETNVEWDRLFLSNTNDVPADCDLMIIAGPSKARFDDSELAKIENYLKQGRRMLVLLNNSEMGSPSGIEKVLAKWGIGVAGYKIVDKDFSSPTGGDIIPAQVKGTHPILKSIVAERMEIYLIWPRTVFPKNSVTPPPADAPQVEILAATSTNAIGQIRFLNANGVADFHQETNSFPLIVAVEHGSIKNVTERGVTRILVLGDSLCFDNALLDTKANHYFANAAINWLNRPQMLLSGIGPKYIKEYKIVLTSPQTRKLQWLLLAGMPGSVLLIGGLVWLRRRR